jgi:uncharacterized cupredoxin-like copper-binding protein
VLLLLAVALSLFVAGCGDDDDGADGEGDDATTPAGEGTAVNVTLQEFNVIPDADSGPAGEFTFNITNVGPDDTHEFVVFKTDLAPDSLPTVADGSVDETGEGVELIDEVEDVAVDADEAVTVDLEAGDYVFICNVVEGDEVHYALGMTTSFTVK